MRPIVMDMHASRHSASRPASTSPMLTSSPSSAPPARQVNGDRRDDVRAVRVGARWAAKPGLPRPGAHRHQGHSQARLRGRSAALRHRTRTASDGSQVSQRSVSLERVLDPGGLAEKGDRTAPMAKDIDGVTAAIERLLGLSYEDFTQCVVLPQGKFADFLHAQPLSGRRSCSACSARSTTSR